MALKIINAIVSYIFCFGIWGLWAFITFYLKLNQKSKLTVIGLFISLGFLIFNLIYTGLMGWNALPGSNLEALLDNISGIGSFSGLIVFYIGILKK